MLDTTSIKIPYNEPTTIERCTNTISNIINTHTSVDSDIVVVCIGTDRSTGDSLGPLVGTFLQKQNLPFKVYGTIKEPVHALNLEETNDLIQRRHKNPFVIAVDACLGKATSVGCVHVALGSVRPGAGVNKELKPIGDMHFTGIVNQGGFMEYFVLQNTRLHLVMEMAEVIGQSITNALRDIVIEKTPKEVVVFSDVKSKRKPSSKNKVISIIKEEV